MVRLELLYSTRNAAEFTSLRDELDALPDCPIAVPEWKRALAVYEQLALQGGLHHRSVRHRDLLIAAAAEGAGIPVLHYDEDYDRVASITGKASAGSRHADRSVEPPVSAMATLAHDHLYILAMPKRDRVSKIRLLSTHTASATARARRSRRDGPSSPPTLHCCVVAQAALSARLPLSPRSSSDPGQGCPSRPEGGLSNQSGDRPARRHSRDQRRDRSGGPPDRRLGRPAFSRRHVLAAASATTLAAPHSSPERSES